MKKILMVIGFIAILLVGGCSLLVVGAAIGGSGGQSASHNAPHHKASQQAHKAAQPAPQPSASASPTPSPPPAASASPAPSAAPSSGQVAVKVVVSASKPVDVTILSAKDMNVPMISEETAGKTYTFTKKASADLTVSASDPSMDVNADDNISVKVYEDGKLRAEDSDSTIATVQY